jgi:hypothetical protein
MALDMLCAYYDRTVDSTQMFGGFEIAQDASFDVHRNKYDVVYLNMVDFLRSEPIMPGMLDRIKQDLVFELEEEYGEIKSPNGTLEDILLRVYNTIGTPFIFLIDEWDCIFRQHQGDKAAQREYLDFLRGLLKDKAYVGLAYMTGILPVHKYGVHSALNMMYEYSMTSPEKLARFVGFTQEEVDGLCERYGRDVEEVKAWYNGYRFPGVKAVYSPQSVVRSMLSGSLASYWTQTETYEALRVYIDMNYDGLRDSVVALLAGDKIEVDVNMFANDMVTFAGADDVLTLLVHLGYLGYDENTKEVFVPNKEIYEEFVRAMKPGGYDEVIKAVKASKVLLDALWAEDAASVAAGIEAAHYETSHLTYNSETALSYTLSLALYAAREYYTIVRELPAGKGFADLAFIPRPFHPEKPAMLVELKWDKDAKGGIAQMHDKDYPASLTSYHGDMLLVGVNYDKDSREHSCVIERYKK